MFETHDTVPTEVPDDEPKGKPDVQADLPGVFADEKPRMRKVYPFSAEGRALAQRRHALGLSLRQAAEKLGIPPQTLNAVEHGRQVFIDPRDWTRAAEMLAAPAARAFAPASDGYPPGWPRCSNGCGNPAIDGKATCGRANCKSAPAGESLHDYCTVVRTVLVTHSKVNLGTGAITESRQAWETRPCRVPLFSEDHRSAGVCRSCARGWNHPNNYRADGPRPEVEVDPAAPAGGG